MKKSILFLLMALVALPALASPPDTAIKRARTYNNTWIKPGTAMMLSKTQHWTMDSLVLDALDSVKANAGSGLSSVSFTNSIPFTNPVTTVGGYNMSTGNLTLTPNTTGALPGATASLRVTSDGVHASDFSAFKLLGGAFDNTAGKVNLLMFLYDGVDYCVSFSQPTAIVANAAPVASSVAFTGTQTQGQTLTGTYSYSDANGDAQGTSLKKWYRSDNNSALNRAAISGATSTTYVLQAGDVGKFIQYAVTPVAATGTSPGAEVFSAYSGAIAALPPPGFTEGFTGGNRSDLAGKTTTTGSKVWANEAGAPGAGNHIIISSGVAKAASATGFSDYCAVDIGSTTTIDTKYVIGSTLAGGIWALPIMLTYGNIVEVNLRDFTVYEIVGGGGANQLAAAVTSGFAAPGDTVHTLVTKSTNNLKVFLNSSSTAVVNVTFNSSISAGTKAGMFTYGDNTSEVAYIICQ